MPLSNSVALFEESWWPLAYARVRELFAQVVTPSDDPQSFSKALRIAMKIELKAAKAMNKLLEKRTLLQSEVHAKKAEYKLRMRRLTAEFTGSMPSRRLRAQEALVPLEIEITEREGILIRLTDLMATVSRLLQVCKHVREDVNKQLKLLELGS